MRKYSWLVLILIISVTSMLVIGCGAKEPSWTAFEGAANVKTFPVPKEANKTDRANGNSDMDFVRYALPGMKEADDIPTPYLQEIAAWGWKEEKEQSAPSQRVFLKDKQIVHLSVHDDYFTLLVPKDTKSAANVQDLSSDKDSDVDSY